MVESWKKPKGLLRAYALRAATFDLAIIIEHQSHNGRAYTYASISCQGIAFSNSVRLISSKVSDEVGLIRHSLRQVWASSGQLDFHKVT